VLTLNRHSRLAVWAWAPFVALLHRERIDILHAHKFGSNVWGTALGRLAHVPVVVAHEHGGAWPPSRLRPFINRELIGRGADVFLTVSAELQRRMIEVERVDASRVRFLANGIPPWPADAGDDVRAELGIAPDAPVIATVCQLRPEKALDLLVDSTALVRERFPDVRVLIAGDGPQEGALRAHVAAKGLQQTVTLLGPRRDVPAVLAAADVAVCCSDFEGTPLSVMEYMAAAKPVVATRVGGLPDLVEDSVQGLLVPPRDAAGLAAALADLLGDPERRTRMGAAARERQLREFSLAATLRSLEDLYEELFRATARARQEGWAPPPRTS
jgi:glycosyltransferase involved in cell wall biosynthesis